MYDLFHGLSGVNKINKVKSKLSPAKQTAAELPWLTISASNFFFFGTSRTAAQANYTENHLLLHETRDFDWICLIINPPPPILPNNFAFLPIRHTPKIK